MCSSDLDVFFVDEDAVGELGFAAEVFSFELDGFLAVADCVVEDVEDGGGGEVHAGDVVCVLFSIVLILVVVFVQLWHIGAVLGFVVFFHC